MKDTDWLQLQGWMLHLGFNTTELILYAIIYGFTRSVGFCFNRTDYFVGWTQTDATTVEDSLEELITWGFIKRQFINGKIVYVALLPDEKKAEV